jgi:hypothetical protein
MIEPARRHGHYDTRWNANGRSPADAMNENAATNGRTGVSKDARRPARRMRAPILADAGGGGAPLQRWEDEGGNFSMDDEPDIEADGSKRAPPGLNWAEFLNRYFPGRRRHDLRALKAYEAYRSESISARSPKLPRIGAHLAGP